MIKQFILILFDYAKCLVYYESVELDQCVANLPVSFGLYEVCFYVIVIKYFIFLFLNVKYNVDLVAVTLIMLLSMFHKENILQIVEI